MGRTPTARQSAAGETISKQRVKWRVFAASRWWMLGWEKTFEIELKPNCAAADEGQRERGAVAPRLCRHRSYARAVHQDIRHGILAPGLKAAEESEREIITRLVGKIARKRLRSRRWRG
jgi:hypothetical protein